MADTKKIVAQVPSFIYVYSDGTIERPRDLSRVPPSLEDPVTGVSSKDIVLQQDPYYLSARLYLPKLTQSNSNSNPNQKIPILVYFHGGAFCCESAFATHNHTYCNIIASQGNVIIVSIEHRKAPEHFLPAAYDNCWAGLQWVASHHHHATDDDEKPSNCDQWLISHGDYNKIFIGGESSGANYAHNIAMRAGVETLPGGVKIYGAYLNHPAFWGSKPFESEPVTVFKEALMPQLWNFAYPNAPSGLDNPLINPLAPGAPNLATLGCSKMFISVAGKDRLYYRGVLYYEAVKASVSGKGKWNCFKRKKKNMFITSSTWKLNKPKDCLEK